MNMKKLKLFLATTALSALFITSCAPPVYHPNVANIPLFDNQGEVTAAVYSGTSGFDPQIAIAVTDNIGIMFNGAFNKFTEEDSKDYQTFQYGELGLGFYKKIIKNLKFEVYGGAGYGHNNFYSYVNDNKTVENVTYTKFFIQPVFGTSTKFFEGGFSPRIVLAAFNDSGYNYHKTYIEPIVTAKVGVKYFKFVIQGGLSIPIIFGDNDIFYIIDERLHRMGMLSFGLHVQINKR
jgi:hypothetical protein